MSNVSVMNNDLTLQQQNVLEAFKEFQIATIEKDSNKLNEIIDEKYTLTHMSGKTQTKCEFIDEIIDGTLNYFKSRILKPEIIFNDENQATLRSDVELNAMVYGIKGTWTLNSIIKMIKKENKWLITEWKT